MGFFDAQPAEPQKLCDIEAYFLNYDIPDNADLEPDDKKPAPFLRSFAFHAQKSGWIVQHGDIPHGLISRWVNAGCVVDLIKFDASETPKLLAMAVRSITAELEEKKRNAASSYADNLAELHDNETDADSAFDRFKRKNAAIVARLTKHLEAVKKCAERWGVAAQIPSLSTSSRGILSLRQTMKVRAKAYATAIAELRKRDANCGIANAMEADQIPAGIAADFMDDMGLNGVALRSAFFAEE